MTEAKIPAKGRIDLEDADVDLLATFYKIQSFCSFFEWVRLVNYLPVTDNRKAVSGNGVKGSIDFFLTQKKEYVRKTRAYNYTASA